MSDSNPSVKVSGDRRVSMPFAVLLAVIAVACAGAVGLNATRDQVERSKSDISALQSKFDADHDMLVQINANVRRLLREDGLKP